MRTGEGHFMTHDEAWTETQNAIKWCMGDGRYTDSGRILAKTILNCYNDRAYPKTELGGIGSLDRANYRKMMGVIELRFYGDEPHQVMERGSELIEQIAKLYRIRRSK